MPDISKWKTNKLIYKKDIIENYAISSSDLLSNTKKSISEKLSSNSDLTGNTNKNPENYSQISNPESMVQYDPNDNTDLLNYYEHFYN